MENLIGYKLRVWKLYGTSYLIFENNAYWHVSTMKLVFIEEKKILNFIIVSRGPEIQMSERSVEKFFPTIGEIIISQHPSSPIDP